eukprot:Gregarina_sp_Poly_1__6176@NODE_326_length_9503_cov_249_815388_g278_i0_p1_GENE_NODE_326_length_9503_cov_249_815388_g278_i0NODE_326_length_9503_cov_249_815388_g278_i0_p1_ORF_typecomplete_len1100_score138_82Lactamase_B/PF00753_27/2_7e16Lactamase_B_2/PF12706_7/7_5e07Lactamase_B_3/PF13483_6/0_021_NODE_326_length_9503_cov_249_815388_g278_i061209419
MEATLPTAGSQRSDSANKRDAPKHEARNNQFSRRQTLLDSAVVGNVAIPVSDEAASEEESVFAKRLDLMLDKSSFPDSRPQGITLKRRAAGCQLAVVLLLVIALSPLWLLALLVQRLMRLILLPAKKMLEIAMPEFIRLWYIHKIGCLHSKIAGGWRRKGGRRPHSRPVRVDIRSARKKLVSIHTIAQLSDNVGYLIVNRGDADSDFKLIANSVAGTASATSSAPFPAVLIDCADAKATQAIAESICDVHYSNQPISIEAVLTTHHHWDHQGGNKMIKKLFPSINVVVGGAQDRVRECNFYVRDKQRFSVAGLEFESISVPCHTRGSMIYRLLGENKRDCVFLGDTLFIGGCGACFEGTVKEMQRNFAKILLTFHPDSLLFPGHEYTERILMEYFPSRAAQMAIHNPKKFFSLCAALCRAHHLRALPFPAPTIPVRLRDEITYNSNFEPAIKACSVLKLAVYHCRPQAAQSLRDAVYEGDASPVKFGNANQLGIATVGDQRCRPRVAINDNGGVIVIEPPWISDDTMLSNPFVVMWRHDLDNIIYSLERSTPQNIKSMCLNRLLRLRDEGLSVDPDCGLRGGRNIDLPKSKSEAEELLSVLTEESFLTKSQLEDILGLPAEITNGIALSFQDIDQFFLCLNPTASLASRSPSNHYSLKDISRFISKQSKVTFSIDADWLNVKKPVDDPMLSSALAGSPNFGSVTNSGVFPSPEFGLELRQARISTISPQASGTDNPTRQVMTSNSPPSLGSGPGVMALTNIFVHDFTTCRICQALPVLSDASKAIQFVHGGEIYSNRRSGLTTLITAADSSNSRVAVNQSLNNIRLLSFCRVPEMARNMAELQDAFISRLDTCPNLSSQPENCVAISIYANNGSFRRASSYPPAGAESSASASTDKPSASTRSKAQRTLTITDFRSPLSFKYAVDDPSIVAFLAESPYRHAGPSSIALRLPRNVSMGISQPMRNPSLFITVPSQSKIPPETLPPYKPPFTKLSPSLEGVEYTIQIDSPKARLPRTPESPPSTLKVADESVLRSFQACVQNSGSKLPSSERELNCREILNACSLVVGSCDSDEAAWGYALQTEMSGDDNEGTVWLSTEDE